MPLGRIQLHEELKHLEDCPTQVSHPTTGQSCCGFCYASLRDGQCENADCTVYHKAERVLEIKEKLSPNWISLTIYNDWGYNHLVILSYPLGDYYRNCPRIEMADETAQLTARFPSGEIRTITLRKQPHYMTVSDMGQSYGVKSWTYEVLYSVDGVVTIISLDQLEYLAEEVLALSSKKPQEPKEPSEYVKYLLNYGREIE